MVCRVSSPMVQFQLLHSKFHLCCLATRQLMLSTYVKFVNLFPEIKTQIQQVNLPLWIITSLYLYVKLLLAQCEFTACGRFLTTWHYASAVCPPISLSARITDLRYVYKWIGKCMWLVISTLIENEALLKVTGSRVHCKCNNILEMV